MAARTFPLDAVIGAGAAAALELSGTTSMDVVTAVTSRKRMPTRPDGVLVLGSIGLNLSSGEDLRFSSGPTRLDVSFAAGVSAGLGIYDVPEKALAALDLGETPGLDIAIADPDDTRFVLLRAGYSAAGGVTGTHPIGAVGSFSFGTSGKAAGVMAVLQAFNDSERTADAILSGVAKSWRLPRHVTAAEDLAPRTWLIAEAEGSVAGRGGTGHVGLDVSGRYLVVVGRETDEERLRLRMFKPARRGAEFGLNLKVAVHGVDTLTPARSTTSSRRCSACTVRRSSPRWAGSISGPIRTPASARWWPGWPTTRPSRSSPRPPASTPPLRSMPLAPRSPGHPAVAEASRTGGQRGARRA